MTTMRADTKIKKSGMQSCWPSLVASTVPSARGDRSTSTSNAYIRLVHAFATSTSNALRWQRTPSTTPCPKQSP